MCSTCVDDTSNFRLEATTSGGWIATANFIRNGLQQLYRVAYSQSIRN